MDYLVIVTPILILFALAAVGFIAYRQNILTEAGNRSISKLVLYVTLPAMILASVSDVPQGFSAGDILFLLAISFISYGVMGLIAFAVPRVLGGEKKDYGVYSFLTLFGNVGFMGFPVLTALFGSQAVFLAAIFNLPMNLLSFTIGVLMIAPKGTRISFRSLLTPAVLSSVAAPLLYLAPFTIPATIYDGFSLLGSATVPLAMMMIGSSIAQMPFSRVWNQWRTYLVSVAKLLVCPVLVFFVLRLFVSNSLFLATATILAAMPSATNTTLFCIEYGGNEALSSQTVCISTILSAVTMPLIAIVLL